METGLTVYTEDEKALLAQFSPEDLLPAGIDNLKPGDTGMPPRLVISQPNRPVEVASGADTAGKIVNTVTGEVFDSLEVVVLMFMNDTRVMWPTTFNTENDPECLSDNGKAPTASEYRKVTNPQRGPCTTCPFAQFGTNSEKPRCMEQRNFLVWVVDSGEPAILTAQSTSLKQVRHLTTLARTKGLKQAIVMTPGEVKDAKGRWFVPLFASGGKLTAAQIVELIEAKRELQNLVAVAATEIREEVNGNGEPVIEAQGEEMPF